MTNENHESHETDETGGDAPSPCEGCEGAKKGRRGFLFAAGTTLLTVGGGLAAIPIVGVAIAPARQRSHSAHIIRQLRTHARTSRGTAL